MGGLLIDDDAIVPSSILESPLDEVAMVPDSKKQSVCCRSLFYQRSSLFAASFKSLDGRNEVT